MKPWAGFHDFNQNCRGIGRSDTEAGVDEGDPGASRVYSIMNTRKPRCSRWTGFWKEIGLGAVECMIEHGCERVTSKESKGPTLSAENIPVERVATKDSTREHMSVYAPYAQNEARGRKKTWSRNRQRRGGSGRVAPNIPRTRRLEACWKVKAGAGTFPLRSFYVPCRLLPLDHKNHFHLGLEKVSFLIGVNLDWADWAATEDDDFLFQAEDSPAKPPPSSRRKPGNTIPPDRRWSGQSQAETLAWDEELEREEAERQSSVGSSSLGQTTGANAAVDLSRWAEGDEEDDAEFGFDSRRVSDPYVHEDTVSPLPVFPHNPVAANTLPSPSKRTRTHSPSRSSGSASQSASAQSSPLMPTRQVPGSPALSLFSTSTSTAQPYTPSLAGSTAHLRHTRSREASSPVGPFVPAQPRVPRRRLRKKSRPARPGDIDEDEAPTSYVMREPSPQGLGLAMEEEDEEASWSENSSPQERTPSPVQSPL
ncbi:hypothetical protein AG1IA_08576 [Rhizoctonia solani AG-1 IA]|uniref:Uncharacterized protein n=1 Tax=Thanatephorus cucumeris (strain AG1-IA) TaxID=983506 RepID=L8WM23_THACA|nr:hypothetical protein AG1IA_08576 [Rhizoctonia solani AG-1 IA]